MTQCFNLRFSLVVVSKWRLVRFESVSVRVLPTPPGTSRFVKNQVLRSADETHMSLESVRKYVMLARAAISDESRVTVAAVMSPVTMRRVVEVSRSELALKQTAPSWMWRGVLAHSTLPLPPSLCVTSCHVGGSRRRCGSQVEMPLPADAAQIVPGPSGR